MSAVPNNPETNSDQGETLHNPGIAEKMDAEPDAIVASTEVKGDPQRPGEGSATVPETNVKGSTQQMETAAATDPDPPAKDCLTKADTPSIEAPAAMTVTEDASNNKQVKDPDQDDARQSWDNSHRKVVVHHMFKFTDNKKGRKLAEQWAKDATKESNVDISIYKVRKPPSDTFMVVTLTQTNMVQPFIDYINNNPNVTNKRGVKLFAKPAVSEREGDDNDDNNERKRKNRGDDEDNGNAEEDEDDGDDDGNSNRRSTKRGVKRQQRDEIMEAARRPMTEDEIRKRITPLFHLTAKEQAIHKQRDMVRNCARKMVQEIKGRFRTLNRDVNRQKKNQEQKNQKHEATYKWLNNQRCVQVDNVRSVPSPLRNKVEFTFGYRYSYVYENDTTPNSINQNAQVDGQEPHSNKQTTDDRQSQTITKTDLDVDAAVKDATPIASENVSAVPIPSKAGTTVPVESTDVSMQDITTSTPQQQTSTNTKDSQHTETLEAQPAAKTTSNLQAVTKLSSVGFMASGWSGGVSKPHCCANIPSEMCTLVDVLEEFLKDSRLPPYDPKNHTGFWRYLTVRTSRRTQQCLIVLVHAPVTGGIGDSGSVNFSSIWETEKKRLLETLQSARLPIKSESGDCIGELQVTSMFLQEFGGVSNPPQDHPVQHVFGKKVLEEKLGNSIFQISPGAFFQVNTAGAELLYRIVMDKLSEFTHHCPDGNTDQVNENNNVEKTRKKIVLFDVCCGTGTIGLACLKEGVVDQVIGIDISEPAIEDARRNAKVNGFSDETVPKATSSPCTESIESTDGSAFEPPTRFVASRAEFVMSKEIDRATKRRRSPGLSRNLDAGPPVEHIYVAVVDPAREGLHADVVRALRQTKQIHRIVYVSCNPTGSLVKDAGLLCAPPTKRYPGRAFRPTSAIPVDMFPLTSHCEMVMTFDRVQDDEM